MDTGRQALILFYAVFWAAALNVTGRYQPFDTPSMWECNPRAWKRFGVSLIILNFLPIVWLVFFYLYVIPNNNHIIGITAAACGSISVFGWHRILHSLIASDKFFRNFYTDSEITNVRNRGNFIQPQTFSAHFFPGIIYIAFFSILAYLLSFIAN